MAMLFMNTLELTKYFMDTGLNVDKTLFINVTDTLDTDSSEKNVISINELMPNTQIISLHDEKRDAYRTSYVRYLQLPPINATLAVLQKYCIDDDRHIVFLCSVQESQYRYLEIIQDYLELVFDFKMYHVKDYLKALKKGKVIDNNKASTLAKINEQLELMKKKDPNIETVVDAIINGTQKKPGDGKEDKKKDKKKKDKKGKDKKGKGKKKDKKKKKKKDEYRI